MLELRDIQKSFGSHTIFDGITIRLPDAKAYALTGINGSGKSTFLKMLWGELKPDSGEILYKRQKVDPQSRSWKSMISVVPDDNALIGGLSALGHFRLVGSLLQLSLKDIGLRSQELIELLDLQDAISAPSVDEMSRGNRKRIALALALLSNPEVILMDEPLSSLYTERSGVLKALIRELASRGKTIIYSCHSYDLIRDCADSYLLIRDLKMQLGLSHDLKAHEMKAPISKEALGWLL